MKIEILVAFSHWSKMNNLVIRLFKRKLLNKNKTILLSGSRSWRKEFSDECADIFAKERFTPFTSKRSRAAYKITIFPSTTKHCELIFYLFPFLSPFHFSFSLLYFSLFFFYMFSFALIYSTHGFSYSSRKHTYPY